MAITLESLGELTSWDSYRTFMKERLKQLPDGENLFFISKKKVDFDLDGKPWKGYAVLIGPKGELAVKKIRKEGVQFHEGTCRPNGKDFQVDGVPVNLMKSAELTFKKLRLGYSIAGVVPDEEPTGEVDVPALKRRLADLVAGIKKNSVLADMDPKLKPFLDEATSRATQAAALLKGPEPEGAEALIAEGEEFLQQAIVGVLEGGEPTEAEEIETRRQELMAELKDAAASRNPENEETLKQAATKARDVMSAVGKKDYEQAEALLDELEELLGGLEEGPEPEPDADPDLAGLGDWDAYRMFLKAHLKRLPPEGGPFYVSRKKVEFTIKGKPYKGFAVLLGKKARLTVQELKKEGKLFQEGTCERQGKNLVVHEIKPELFKGAAKTFVKLRLGRKLVAGRPAPEELLEGSTDPGAESAATGGAAAAAAGAAAASPPKLSKKLLRKVQDVADALVKLREACDALKKAGVSDQPYRGDFDKLTNQLGAITQSADSEDDKEAQLKKLKTTVTEKTLDAKVANLDPKKNGALIAKQIKARFGVKFKFKGGKAKNEGETLKSLYLTLAKVPDFPKSHLKKLEVTLKPATAKGEGGVYYASSKKAAVDCKRPKDSLNYGNQLGSNRYFPDGVDENCKPANSDPVKYFNWATLHEVAHAVDAKHKFMDGKLGKAKYGNWTEYGNNVAPIAKVVAGEFGKGLAGKDLEGLEAYATALMRNKSAKPANSPDEEAKRADVKEWVDAVRVGKSLWWNGSECKKREIGGVVYQEAYDFSGGWWNSYDLAARSQGIHGYQFRAPGEWFAELYAAYYSEKLKPSHPFVPDLKSLEAPSK